MRLKPDIEQRFDGISQEAIEENPRETNIGFYIGKKKDGIRQQERVDG